MAQKHNQNGTKINKLVKNWPQGTVATQAWLETHGIYSQLTNSYVKSNWLTRIGRGVFIKSDENIDWTGGLYTLQRQTECSVHAGGNTALNLQGLAHYLPLSGHEEIFLFAPPKIKLPGWFNNYKWEAKMHFHRTNLFPEYDIGLTQKDLHTYSITISTPERAILETIYLTPRLQTFEGARQLLEGLTSLRPNLVQSLLEECNSIKVKRVFMYLAEESNHQWVEDLNISKIDMGKGKRVIYPNGHFDKKYQITVPGTKHGNSPTPTI